MYLCFAPMDGITNCATRLITQQIFQSYKNEGDILDVWTEFMNVDGFLINPQQVIKHILTSESQKPIVQIYGGNADTLIKATEKIQSEYGNLFSGIELNTGCPSNTVMKVGGGSDMLKDKTKTLEIIKQLSKIKGSLPFSLKTRAGLNDADKISQTEFIAKASSYCTKISIHGRTLKQLYSGEADRTFIQNVKNEVLSNGNPECQIIGNGGIGSYLEAIDHFSKFGTDGVMIGQAAIGNPWIFTSHQPTIQEKLDIILKHLDYYVACDQRFDERIANNADITSESLNITNKRLNTRIEANLKGQDFQPHTIVEFRKFLFQYVKGIAGSKERKQDVISCKGYLELRERICQFFK